MPMTDTRYLTPAHKRRILLEWEQTQRDYCHGRIGDIDPDIVPWCGQLNALPGVCTLQLCAGHQRVPDWLESGHLWLWLDASMSQTFDREAFALAQHPLMEKVERLYMASGQEVTSLVFQGNERGKLEESCAVILSFMQRLHVEEQEDDI